MEKDYDKLTLSEGLCWEWTTYITPYVGTGRILCSAEYERIPSLY